VRGGGKQGEPRVSGVVEKHSDVSERIYLMTADRGHGLVGRREQKRMRSVHTEATTCPQGS